VVRSKKDPAKEESVFKRIMILSRIRESNLLFKITIETKTILKRILTLMIINQIKIKRNPTTITTTTRTDKIIDIIKTI